MRLSEAERNALSYAGETFAAAGSFPRGVGTGTLEYLLRLGFLEKGPIAGSDELGYKTTEAGQVHLNWARYSATRSVSHKF